MNLRLNDKTISEVKIAIKSTQALLKLPTNIIELIADQKTIESERSGNLHSKLIYYERLDNLEHSDKSERFLARHLWTMEKYQLRCICGNK